MVLEDHNWEEATNSTGLIDQIYGVLLNEAPAAYCVDDFFRELGPDGEGNGESFRLIDALTDAMNWQITRRRSEPLVEMARETLVYHDMLEKRVSVAS
ncbi:hypothetical protein [Halomarina pelagica]|uniref:hypothetical protein n=1 Tax=Halomarina pelagica TaxID=2961599 RepID=UPI0020C28800|nr:hypothetical protein [Halomarina sp. BND7]